MKTRTRKPTLARPVRRVAALPPIPEPDPADRPLGDDEDEIRYSLTALGEAVLSDQRGRFRGFGPCIAVA
jgi:hypothetical protein